jgi:hypothetical protein
VLIYFLVAVRFVTLSLRVPSFGLFASADVTLLLLMLLPSMKFAVLWFAPLIAAKVISVSTQNGEIIGHDVPGSQGVVEWLGVPYAQPPVGDLRFASPRSYKGSGVQVASKYV